MKRRQSSPKIERIKDKLYDSDAQEFVYLVKWNQEGSFIHDTWEKESFLLKEVPDLIFKYNDELGKFTVSKEPATQ